MVIIIRSGHNAIDTFYCCNMIPLASYTFDRGVRLPWEIVQDDGTISIDQQIVLNKWMCSFKELLNTDNGNSLLPTDDGPSAVRVNNILSDWFSVSTGLKQGCTSILSPLLFTAFVNELIQKLNQCECGIAIGNYANVSALLYADDIVIVSGDEQKLQTMLNCLYTWCSKCGLTINFSKSKALHFRRCSSARTDFILWY